MTVAETVRRALADESAKPLKALPKRHPVRRRPAPKAAGRKAAPKKPGRQKVQEETPA
jgi:hypothetical protein